MLVLGDTAGKESSISDRTFDRLMLLKVFAAHGLDDGVLRDAADGHARVDDRQLREAVLLHQLDRVIDRVGGGDRDHRRGHQVLGGDAAPFHFVERRYDVSQRRQPGVDIAASILAISGWLTFAFSASTLWVSPSFMRCRFMLGVGSSIIV